MTRITRALQLLAAPAFFWAAAATPAASQETAEGYEIRNETVVSQCSRCHEVDDVGRMSRISYLRKTPEGWQTSIRRMVALHGARLDPSDARDIVRYLADEQGLAPDELRPGLFEVERRLIDHDYEGDSGVEFTCIQCHSMGRVITQRRTGEEWALLLATHRALYPLADFQAFLLGGLPEEGSDTRQPLDVAIDHLSQTFPLATPEWSAWAATKRAPRLAGAWVLTGYEPGRGPIHGRVSVTPDPRDPGAFTTTTSYVYAETGERVERAGQALVYTGYQWRGRSDPGESTELREVMLVERDQREMSGRWFTGAYDEDGPDVRLVRAGAGPVIGGLHPRALRRGTTTRVTVYGAGLEIPEGAAADIDFGEGVSVAGVEDADDGALTVRLSVDADARPGARDLFALGTSHAAAVVVHDGIDRVVVSPETGMARVGGGAFPKGYQTFDAIGYDDGPDGEPNTEDDLRLGRVDASWRLEEFSATFDDDDVDFVGAIGQDGRFVPAIDGPNPDRSGLRNNVGDVWVVATHLTADGERLSARAHLVVSVPLYMRFEPWRAVDAPRTTTLGVDR